jgi:aryl sulfotransferase
MTETSTPKIYQTWTVDSRRWRSFSPRDGDVIIATYPKCGTTWMQRIVDLLIFQSPAPRPINEVSPWIDARFLDPIESVIERVEKQGHRRFVKSHLPFDGLPYFEGVRYIHVARDGRDACMSYFNHCAGYTPLAYEAFDRAAPDMGGPAPRCPASPSEFWSDWLRKGIGPGSQDGFPSLSFFDFENTWWQARARENVLLVHYNDLKADLEEEMRRIGAFLSIDVEPGSWTSIVKAATFEEMKRDGDDLLPQFGRIFDGGSQRFLHKGSNGRWRDVIAPEELLLYERKVASRFTPGLALWIENGRIGAGDPRSAAD